jgi:hypothetical protein
VGQGYALSHLEDRLNSAYYKLNGNVQATLAGSSFAKIVEDKFKEVRTFANSVIYDGFVYFEYRILIYVHLFINAFVCVCVCASVY